jgi:hypothetical protein
LRRTTRNRAGEMTERIEEAQEPAAVPKPQQPQEQDDAIGGEIRVAGGAAPRFMRWLAFVHFVWAILYLVVHPRIEHQEIMWVCAGLLTAWLLFFALTKRPADP